MSEIMEKYTAKALEGYEANYQSITEAIGNMETQLENYKDQQAEMLEGIKEMRGELGLSDEDLPSEETPSLTLVNDGTAIE
jgi:chromosome segregation ATPase